ncbi:MAG TPA: class I adenylate-forming enzyme family protein [Micromonosporaceae bacterium]|jgi:acyl-coenzyme A synthetase/AMP-(fatty) acid ligase|nr:class I adenylate-forming enzyme family protein [Micromonosporaceae bacterium]
MNLRAALAADPDLGAGNVLVKLLEHGADPDGPGMTFDVAVDAHPAWTPLTLGQLDERVRARAAWLHERGVKPRDPVAIYASTAADTFLNFMALTRLGAIPALMNGNIPGDVAAEYIRRLRAIGVLTDARHRELLGEQSLGTSMLGATSGESATVHLGDVAQTGTGDPAAAPAPYRHHVDDPIAITHSSGTTRMPTAVVHSHGSLFAATRRIRLAAPRAQGTERVLSALPAPHTAGILTVNQALCNRSELLFLSQQNDGAVILDAIERWRPTGVFGFAVTWAELARFDLSKRDVDSVAIWFNTGDCAHEAHIRRLVAVGSHQRVTREGVVRVPGSGFVDGIGSTEMGHSAFHITHRSDTSRYGRCVGKPHVFADVVLLDLSTGQEVPVGQIGHLGLKSPTLSLGYWNDSVNTYRYRLNGYYLTGDLMYRDEENYFYHLDRAVDSVDLGGGRWLYTAMSEERILVRCPDVRGCTVVAVRQPDETVVTDVLLLLDADADPDADRTEAVRAALGDAAGATLRKVIAVGDADILTGPTGKVRKFLMRQRHLATMGST